MDLPCGQFGWLILSTFLGIGFLFFLVYLTIDLDYILIHNHAKQKKKSSNIQPVNHICTVLYKELRPCCRLIQCLKENVNLIQAEISQKNKDLGHFRSAKARKAGWACE